MTGRRGHEAAKRQGGRLGKTQQNFVKARRKLRVPANQSKKTNEELIADAFMSSAACSACAGVRIGHGGPFGAAIVRDGVIISCAHNMVLHCKDPTRHAEMNAISQACQALDTHDLSDCELFTTCEPCPMCWGAVQWSRIPKVHLGVDRKTAAKYGFDDKLFYDEINSQAGCYGIQRVGFIMDTSVDCKPEKLRVHKNMVEVFDGILQSQALALFTDPLKNHTLRRRFSGVEGEKLTQVYKEVFKEGPDRRPAKIDPKDHPYHEAFMKRAIACAERGSRGGRSKEREPFGVVIVKDGEVIAEAHNSVLQSRDATATAEVNAIRAASEKLGTHNLDGCVLYSTAHPDLMSLGAILWARITHVYCGVTSQLAAQCGFEEGLLHFKDLVSGEGGTGRGMTTVIEGVAKYECEAVFKEWSDREGIIY